MKGKEKYKFAVGDRVIYRCRGYGGNGLREGDHGRVVARQSFRDHNDYIVKFDRFSPEYMDLKEFKMDDGYGWACTEEHLDREGVSDEEDDDPDIKKQKKEEENTMAKRIDWASADFVIKRMMAEGKTQEEIAEKVGCSRQSIVAQVDFLKRAGAISVEVKTSGAEEQKANLNELEETLAAVISEQKEEIDYLKGRVRGLETEVETLTEEAMEAKRLAVKKAERIAELEGELFQTKEALAIAEKNADEDRREKEEVAEKVKRYIEDSEMNQMCESKREALRLKELNVWARKLEAENDKLRRENSVLKKEKALVDNKLAECRDMLEKWELKCMNEVNKTIGLYDSRIRELTEEKNRYLRLVIKQAEGLVGL